MIIHYFVQFRYERFQRWNVHSLSEQTVPLSQGKKRFPWSSPEIPIFQFEYSGFSSQHHAPSRRAWILQNLSYMVEDYWIWKNKNILNYFHHFVGFSLIRNWYSQSIFQFHRAIMKKLKIFVKKKPTLWEDASVRTLLKTLFCAFTDLKRKLTTQYWRKSRREGGKFPLLVPKSSTLSKKVNHIL